MVRCDVGAGRPALRSGERVEGKWPKQGVGFRVRRGTFRLPKGERERNPQAFAMRLPPPDMGSKLTLTFRAEGDDEVINWYLIRVVAQ